MLKRILLVCCVIALLVVCASWLRDALDVDWTAESIRALVDDAGAWAPALFIGLVTFRLTIMVPSQILLTAAGLLFGATLGTIYGAVGMTLSGLLTFAFVRIAGADAIRARFPRRIDAAFALAHSRLGVGAVALATGYPIGLISVAQLGAALTGMTLLHYGVAVAIGATVRAATFSYFGSTLLDDRQLLLGAGVLLAALLVPLLFARTRAWLTAGFGAAEPLRRPKDRSGPQ